MTLRNQFLAALALAASCLGIYFAAVWLPGALAAVEVRERNAAERTLASLARAVAPLIARGDFTAARQTAARVVDAQPDWVAFSLLDARGRPVLEMMGQGPGGLDLTRDIQHEGAKVGSIALKMDPAVALAYARREQARVAGLLAVAGLLFAAAVIGVLEWVLLRRLGRLVAIAEAEAGKTPPGGDALDRLEAHFARPPVDREPPGGGQAS